jgi:energy-coupling factor transporter ATP-binding protein EcfA2
MSDAIGKGYEIDVHEHYCLTGPNGIGKTTVLVFAHALAELLATGSDLALLKALRQEKPDSWGGVQYIWNRVLDFMEITLTDGSTAGFKTVNVDKGEYIVSNNGKQYNLESVSLKDYLPTIPFMNMERHCDSGEFLATLLKMDGSEFSKQSIEELCVKILGLDAVPRFFYEVPKETDYKSRRAWVTKLTEWEDTFSHGEIEMIRLSLCLSIAKAKHRLIFIDGAENGLHIMSQQQLAKLYEHYNENGLQIIYSTYSPSCLVREHCFDLWEGERY